MNEDAVDNPPDLTTSSSGSEESGSEGLATPIPLGVHGVWRSWLVALATDAEAALGAALAYESLPSDARNAWLDALDTDARDLGVPALALYAPLLSVEADGARRARMESALTLAPVGSGIGPMPPRALRGVGPDGTHACILAVPLYLAFVQVLWCRYRPGEGMLSVRHDPIRNVGDASDLREVDGIEVEPTSLQVVVEDLAHAIVADQREQRAPHAALASFAHLFGLPLTAGADVAVPRLW